MTALTINDGPHEAARYRTYLRDHVHTLAGEAQHVSGLGSELLAEWALRTARRPIMSPPYVDDHARIQDIIIGRVYPEDVRYVRLTLAAPISAELQWADLGFNDWHRVSGRYIAPGTTDLLDCGGPYLTTTFQVLAALPADLFLSPLPPAGKVPQTRNDDCDDLIGRAMDTIASLVPAINRIVEPVLTRLDRM